eukprot:202715_1
MAANKTYEFKLVVLGDTSTGKSSIILRFVRGQFSDYQESSVGAAFLIQTVPVQDCSVKFVIWDTAGQERYHSMAPMYYRTAAAAIVVYDITSQESFHRAKSWVKELQRQGSPDIVMALIGNKIDREEEREVAAADAKQYADDNTLYFMECSAKTNINVREVFLAIARQLPKGDDIYDDNCFILDEDLYIPDRRNVGICNCNIISSIWSCFIDSLDCLCSDNNTAAKKPKPLSFPTIEEKEIQYEKTSIQ